VIADNKLTLNGGWDNDLLKVEIAGLKELGFDLDLTGFGELELAALLADKTLGLTDPDEVPDEPEIPVSAPGDVWLLGRHRLVCGDCTSVDNVALALNGVTPHLMVTDPPYGAEYDPAWRTRIRGKLGDVKAFGKVNNDECDEGGCPIGAVIIDNKTRQIMGKGHNTLVQENDPYNHGETSAIRDAGRQNFSQTTLYTTLSPCDVCATLAYMRQFDRVVVGDVTNASGNEELLRRKGVKVNVLEDQVGIALYAGYRRERPDLDLEDWKGLAAVRHAYAAYGTIL
jgi:cytosine/creatinine deaminase